MVIAGSIDIGNLVSGDTSIHGGRSYPEMGALRWRPHCPLLFIFRLHNGVEK